MKPKIEIATVSTGYMGVVRSKYIVVRYAGRLYRPCRAGGIRGAADWVAQQFLGRDSL